MRGHRFSPRALVPPVLALVILLLVVGVTLGHTGSIMKSQSCDKGTTITAHLDSNVAASATYQVKINGAVVATGNGPGPKDLGPYGAGFGAGTASLKITFNQEVNTYPIEFGAVAGCATPTPVPTPTATPVVTPTPTPSATPVVTPSASASIPNTATAASGEDASPFIFIVLVISLVALYLSIATMLQRR